MTHHVFELKYPFEYRGETIIELKARRPKVSDLRSFMKDFDKDPILAMQRVIGNLCDRDDKIIEQVDIEDFAPMKVWFEDFLRPMLNNSNDT